jgi:hypothetical protein
MRNRALSIVIAVYLSTLQGCGDWPPMVSDEEDIRSLPATVESIRARGIGDNDISALARLRELRHLDFSSGYGEQACTITDDGLKRLAELDLPYLETLTLGWCENITDAGLAHIAELESLEWLGLPGCTNITDAGLPWVTDVTKLKGLDLRGCLNITDEGIQQLALKTDWDVILLGGCQNVTAAGIDQLQTVLPQARIEKDDEEWIAHRVE